MSDAVRPSRYHAARQHDGHGWVVVRLDALGTGFPAPCVVVAANMTEGAAREMLEELRAAEVLDLDFPIEHVDADIRASGGDPDAIGKRGAALVAGLLAKRREQAS